MRVTAVLTVRNEASFLLEWLAHHRACGFTDFLVFSNDCTDGTDAMLDRLEAMGWLTHVRNDGPHKEGPQWAALKLADRHPLVRGADWVLYFDIDEFVNIHVGGRTVGDLLAALPDATAITLTWRFFGNAGLSGAGLSGAGLSGAGLSGAGLSGAGLSGAGLSGAG
ncbi:MAG: glycosyltransferase family 2 protein, partial [Tabrizicola sp.]|nr:glycosyltransferase family 2 protein [Tabrizicola sp.]